VGMATPFPIDLDHAAATPMHPEVAATIVEAQGVAHANPSSQHAIGRAARRVLEDARERIVAALGGSGTGPHRERLVFTSGASEANHLALLGMTAASATVGDVLYSRRDHASSVHAAMAAGRRGWRLREMALDDRSGTAAAALSAAISERHPAASRVVSLTLVCGQTGSVEDMPPPMRDISDTQVHVDATQAAGLLAVSFRELPAATLALAPHKFGGPRGIGALLIRGGVAIVAVQAGSQEFGLRGGTEAVPLAAGFARAMELAVADREEAAQRVASLRDRLESRLLDAARQAGIPAIVIAAGARRCPHISTIAFPGLDRQSLAMAADLAGVCLATGTACASGSSEPAPALVAMGFEAAVVRGAVRLSVARTTTAADIEQAVERLTPLLKPSSCSVDRLRGSAE
jgi:cysteine desulfurase